MIMDRQQAHKVLDILITSAEDSILFGQIQFIMHYQNGELKQITDIEKKRTWKDAGTQA